MKCCQSVVDSEKAGTRKGKEKCSRPVVSMVQRGVSDGQWRGLGQEEMTLCIDLI